MDLQDKNHQETVYLLYGLVIAIVKIIKGDEQFLIVDNLDKDLSPINMEKTVYREAIRSIFMEMGIEIAYSGKGDNEKGVIIDMDESRVNELQLDSGNIRFGQTIIRVDTLQKQTIQKHQGLENIKARDISALIECLIIMAVKRYV